MLHGAVMSETSTEKPRGQKALSKNERKVLAWMLSCCEAWEGIYTGNVEFERELKADLANARTLAKKIRSL